MSWHTTGGVEEAAFRAMQEELVKQQLEAERLILQKQKKKEQQLLARQRKRKEQQAIRQEEKQQKQKPPRKENRGRKKKDKTQGHGQATSSMTSAALGAGSSSSTLDSKVTPGTSSPKGGSSATTASTSGILNSDSEEMVPGSGSVLEIDKDKKCAIDKKKSDAVVEKNATLMELSRFQCEYASDEDSIEADYYEPLARHGEHFTKEEVIRLYRSKLRHLKSMYLHQADYIRLAYKEKRRLYLAALEELANSNISYSSDPKILVAGKSKVTPEYIAQQTIEHRRMKKVLKFQSFKGPRAVVRMRARRLCEEMIAKEKGEAGRTPKIMTLEENKLKAASGAGETGIPEDLSDDDTQSCDEEAESEDLFQLFKEARQSQFGGGKNPSLESTVQTCGWQSDRDTIKCQQHALPLTKYCWSHIIHDERQTLFKRCGRPLGSKEETCQIPVLEFMDRLGCPTHRIPFVPDPFEPLNEKKERISQEVNLPTADAEEEESILEDLIGEEVYDLAQFDEAMKYVEKKGLRELDSEDSDDQDNQEVYENELQLASAAAPQLDVKSDIITSDVPDNWENVMN